YNVEDALIINKASLERGLGRSVAYRSFVTEFRRYWGGQEDMACIPDPSVKGYRSEEDYEMLDDQGIIEVESSVPEQGVIVGKISPLRFLGISKEIKMGLQNFRDNSLTITSGNSGIVEKVILTSDAEGNKIVSAVVRDTKTPEVGDKMATRHGQKGVIGLVVPEEDMPFTADGIVPDIIINPHAIPSRMTVGQLLEIIAGKVGALAAKRVNGTVFKGDEEKIRTALKYMGFRDDGKETLYNGVTGEKMEVPILTGITYYYRLYHLVSKKIHARSKGPVALMTKQPTEGRSKEGGLRLGEMEKDCFIAHGAPITLKERFGSDKVSIPVCKDCGVIAIEDHIKNRTYCPLCKNDVIVNVEMSYAFKLMLDELRSLLIYPQIVPESS
ncbi:MAG: DNA-directed RNA polymerase subunit B, partial [Candidatus Aenigmarchaeota archaeon]|nr:DNA-directed RNA polymerase subunit B [Candidatus Aenigmarchaeota archaeon]